MGAQGYLRRLTRRLTEDLEQRDVEELSDEVLNAGAQRAIDCQRGQEVTVLAPCVAWKPMARVARVVFAPNCSTAATPSRWCGWVNAGYPASTRAVPAGARPAGQAGKWDEGYLQPALRNSAVTIRQSELPVSRER